MASVSVTYAWAKHASLTVEIYAEDSFPDAVDEASVQAVRAMKAALADIVNTEAGE